jgi:hypothetical protein
LLDLKIIFKLGKQKYKINNYFGLRGNENFWEKNHNIFLKVIFVRFFQNQSKKRTKRKSNKAHKINLDDV